MKVNGQIPEIKDGGEDEAQPMYQGPHRSTGHNHVHEEAPVDLLAMETENQFQVQNPDSLSFLSCYLIEWGLFFRLHLVFFTILIPCM